MRFILISIKLLIAISFSYGQRYSSYECPIDSLKSDSVYILNEKFEEKLVDRVRKYQPKRKIVRLWFQCEQKKGCSTSYVALLNSTDAGYSILIKSDKIYGYFVIDSVLFVIENENVPNDLFLISDKFKLLFTEKENCKFITLGISSEIECTYKIKGKADNLRIREQNTFFRKTEAIIVYYFWRIFRRKPQP